MSFTALMAFSRDGQLEAVEALIGEGNDVNERDINGASALGFASERGHREIVVALLAAGADANSKRNDGWTALHFASQDGHLDIVRALLAGGGDVNANAIGGVTPLYLACQNGHLEDQLQKVIQVVETLQARAPESKHTLDLARYSGVLHLTEDPLQYQERVRSEWS